MSGSRRNEMGFSPVAVGRSYRRLALHFENSIQLAKVHLSLFVAFSALFGCYLKNPHSGMTGWGILAAVFFLSCGCGTLNNIQDRDIDTMSERTCNRTLPRHRVTVGYATLQGGLLVAGALCLLFVLTDSHLPVLLGALAVVLYNGCYTPLKRTSLWAMVPGTLCGMLPPLIGWTASPGGGSILEIVLVMALMGLWQLPHTWLVLCRYSSKDPGHTLPSFTDRLGAGALKRILFVWVLAFAVLTVLFAGNPAVSTGIVRWMIVLNSAGLALGFFVGLYIQKQPPYGRLFLHLNVALAVVMSLVVFERIVVFG
jgi:heme o synthase